jgi:Tfp pilus assembly protein PilN
MQSINLIPQQEVQEQTKSKLVKFSTVFSIILLIVVAGASFYFFYNSKQLENRIENLDKEILNIQREIESLSDIEVIARNLDKKFNVLKELFDSRVYYSKLLSEIDLRRPEGLRVQTFAVRADDELNISGNGNNYIVISDYTKNLLQEQFGESEISRPFESVSLQSVSLDNKDNSANFSIVVKFRPDAFQR